jgi:L-rhamnonate dehydratase
MLLHLDNLDRHAKVERIEYAPLKGKRPRVVGKNARLPNDHGQDVTVHIVRLTVAGTSGFGWSTISRASAQQLIGRSIGEMLDEQSNLILPRFRAIEFPLLDWLGKAPGHPVYGLIDPAALARPADKPLLVPCYDGTIYFDDLGRAGNDADAGKIIREEIESGMSRGHRNFKLKVGRGARHMPTMDGLKRDIAVTLAARDRAGADGTIMVDANNGYTVNLAIEFLRGTRDANVYWLEEPFHEDPPADEALKHLMRDAGLNPLIADGEGEAAPHLLDWCKSGVIDVLQYDVLNPGFTRWLELAESLNAANVRAAPHGFGTTYANFAACQVSPALKRFLFAEWDQATIEGLDGSGYGIENGQVSLPNRPGFGLELDSEHFQHMVTSTGWTVVESASR